MNETILKQLTSIRDTGAVNMFDYPAVQRLAFNQGFYELVNYIEEDPGRYCHFILTGKEG